MNKNSRMTAWFSPTERHALQTEADRVDATVGWVIRRAVRKYLGPEKMKKAAEYVMDVADNQP